MAVYRTTFPIGASVDTVWDVLTDFERYPEWNPSLPSISGELKPGSTVSLMLAMPGRPSPKVKASFGDVEPGRRLTWHGNVGADWLFAGTREFLIDAQPDGTVRFTHVEDVRGMLFPLFNSTPAGRRRGNGVKGRVRGIAARAMRHQLAPEGLREATVLTTATPGGSLRRRR